MRRLGAKALVSLFAGLVILCAFADSGDAATPFSAYDHTTACATLDAGSLEIPILTSAALPTATSEVLSVLFAAPPFTSPVRSVDHPPEPAA